MPGIKRKEAPVHSSKRTKHSQTTKHKSRPSLPEVNFKVTHRDDENDDFDDGKDLLAGALVGENEDDESENEQTTSVGKDNGDADEVMMLSDEDMEGGFEDVAADNAEEAGPSRARSSLYAIPSRDEMTTLKNTRELYKSNIFKLKVEEMTAEVRPKYEKARALDFVLRQLKSVVESIASIEAQPLSKSLQDLKRRQKKNAVTVPFPDPQPKKDSPLKFGFEKPSRVQIVGSWILRTAAIRSEGVDVDMVLYMPSSLFQEKDHLNMRYFHKRAFYLAVLATAIQEEESLDIQCEYALVEEDVRRPHLLLKPVPGSGQSDYSKTKAVIKIHLAHEDGLFPTRRLGPDRNNMRVEDIEESQQPPTPCYNAAILADGLFGPHLLYLNATGQMSSSFQEACILLKTWASQRAFGSGLSKAEIRGRGKVETGRRVASGAGSMRFILSMLLAHLLHGSERAAGGASKSRLSPGFSSYQLFRGTIDFLASHDFAAEPVMMKATEGLPSWQDKIDSGDFSKHSNIVLVDPTGSVNLLQAVDRGTFTLLQSEARSTLALLNDAEEDHFEEVFLRERSRPSFAFDDVIRLNCKNIQTDAAVLSNFGSDLRGQVKGVAETLHEALNNRARLVTFFVSSKRQWSVNSARPRPAYNVEIGLTYNSEQAFRLVDHGPRPEIEAEAAKFKDFWGELAELRRFRDGRVLESVVWSTPGPMERTSIPRSIIRHVLLRHHSVEAQEISFHSEAFQGLLLPSDQLARDLYLTSPAEGGFITVQNAFNIVVKALRGLQDLPLSLISVVGADAGLRALSAMIPAPVDLNNRRTSIPTPHLSLLDFVITLESSGRWPDDLEAIQAMKMAFYEAMAAKLPESIPSCQTNVVFDFDAEDNQYWDRSALEIVLSSGLAFRGRIHHERERFLLHRILEDKDEVPYHKFQAKAALERHEVRFEHNVRHHNHMAALVHRFVSFGEAVRLFKRWVSSQMLGIDVPEQLCELLVASVYIEASEGSEVPSMGQTGFVRTLQQLSDWDWRNRPLIVALTAATSSTPTGKVSADTRTMVGANFEQMRKVDPGLNRFAWFICTENELKGCCWAVRHPTSGTADALQRLARGACGILAAGSYLSRESVQSLFVPSLDHFDFLIYLEPAAVNRYLESVTFDSDLYKQSLKRLDSRTEQSGTSKYRNLSLPSSKGVMAGLDIGTEFVKLLTTIFSDTMRLYYDNAGGVVIGGLFNPSLSKPRPFRVGLGFSSKPVDDKTKDIALNQTDVLAEIERLGRGLIERVERRA